MSWGTELWVSKNSIVTIKVVILKIFSKMYPLSWLCSEFHDCIYYAGDIILSGIVKIIL